MIDAKALGQELAAIVKAQISPMEARIADLEKRLADAGTPVDVVNALIDRTGNLVLTMSDGTVKDLGPVVGKDGEPGKPGRDGFSLEDFDATLMDDGRTVLLAFVSNDQSFKVELGIPTMIYRGVYQDGSSYQKGDTVTWGGSLWHCDADKTDEKPDSAEKHWTLAAKKGRDGKDGVMKEAKAHAPLRIRAGGDVR
ncbi:hypothetical protein [Mycoplana rhizolycopersici]|uniref:Uncharacterized protein n=1 Tax=Mycoplana rhizolycopersici TaxID=2746702 RepID=A0ABX2QGB7_9HYPH|nr:hypothetical protein [Rhizobium rhizolycopersici]NVP55969.1 hypothetical protein [Rhizobium rhizolycopersici]